MTGNTILSQRAISQRARQRFLHESVRRDNHLKDDAMDGQQTIVDRLSNAVALARSLGAEIRHENLGETPAGFCRVGNRVRVYLDMSDGPEEQLRTVAAAIEVLQARQQPLPETPMVSAADHPTHAAPSRDAA